MFGALTSTASAAVISTAAISTAGFSTAVASTPASLGAGSNYQRGDNGLVPPPVAPTFSPGPLAHSPAPASANPLNTALTVTQDRVVPTLALERLERILVILLGELDSSQSTTLTRSRFTSPESYYSALSEIFSSQTVAEKLTFVQANFKSLVAERFSQFDDPIRQVNLVHLESGIEQLKRGDFNLSQGQVTALSASAGFLAVHNQSLAGEIGESALLRGLLGMGLLVIGGTLVLVGGYACDRNSGGGPFVLGGLVVTASSIWGFWSSSNLKEEAAGVNAVASNLTEISENLKMATLPPSLEAGFN